jgi:hypothetical protein
MRRILILRSDPPQIRWIPRNNSCILRCGLCPLGHPGSSFACIEFASEFSDYSSECSKSFDFVSELKFEVEYEYSDSSCRAGGRKIVSTCGSRGEFERLSSNRTLCLKMSWSVEGLISLYSFTPYGYPKKIHALLFGYSSFIFSEGMWAHPHDPKIRK